MQDDYSIQYLQSSLKTKRNVHRPSSISATRASSGKSCMWMCALYHGPLVDNTVLLQ